VRQQRGELRDGRAHLRGPAESSAVTATRFGSSGDTPLSDATVLDYWLWAFSDLWGNTERGQLAEFVVARAH
jgi:hypothetical protein